METSSGTEVGGQDRPRPLLNDKNPEQIPLGRRDSIQVSLKVSICSRNVRISQSIWLSERESFCVPPSGVGGRRTRTNGRRKSNSPPTCCTLALVLVFLSLSRPELRHGERVCKRAQSPGRYHSLWRMRSNASQPNSNHLKQTTEKEFSEIEESRPRVGPSSRALRRTCG